MGSNPTLSAIASLKLGYGETKSAIRAKAGSRFRQSFSGLNKPMEKLLSYFNVRHPWDIRWAHAVNTREKLEQYCHPQQSRIIEGDISLIGGTAVMAHDLTQEADLTFEVWIKSIGQSSNGAKLDFKDPRVILPCLTYLRNVSLRIPVFLNADILQGPHGVTPRFEASKFIDLCQKYYPQGILPLCQVAFKNVQ